MLTTFVPCPQVTFVVQRIKRLFRGARRVYRVGVPVRVLKIMVLCAASCPLLLILGGLFLIDRRFETAGICACLAGFVDLMGYVAAIIGESHAEKNPANHPSPH